MFIYVDEYTIHIDACQYVGRKILRRAVGNGETAGGGGSGIPSIRFLPDGALRGRAAAAKGTDRTAKKSPDRAADRSAALSGDS